VAAAITRNSYGCLVLNTARVMFVDVDLPELDRAEEAKASLADCSANPRPLHLTT